MPDRINIKGARVHNLKNIDLEIPRNALVVLTGVSGSGKSSLAFDTIHSEGQRRYMDSLSTYARQLIDSMERADVDLIDGLSPTIALDQHTSSPNVRSTVGTLSEVYDYLRVLFTHLGKTFCYECGDPITAHTTHQIVEALTAFAEGTRLTILAPIPQAGAKSWRETLDGLSRAGFVRIRIDGETRELADEGVLANEKPGELALVVDRLARRPGTEKRLADSLEVALRYGNEVVRVEAAGAGGSESRVFTRKPACLRCGTSFPPLTPRLFSFNSPQGACSGCGGLGRLHAPKREGLSSSEGPPCPHCKGTRLTKESLHVKIVDLNIAELTALAIQDSHRFLSTLDLQKHERAKVETVLREILIRLNALLEMELGYLSLDRVSDSLSGGELQRIRLATQTAGKLAGVVYILDEPTVGLHPKDTQRLLELLRTLRDGGNTVLVVEHDRDVMVAGDHVIDMGPGAGVFGGEIVAQGTAEDIAKNGRSLTGQYLSGGKAIARSKPKRPPEPPSYLELRGARQHNLKNIDVRFPIGRLTCVTGVSGSGKSSLVMDTLYRAARGKLHRAKERPGPYDEILGLELLDRVIGIDQSPIGRTPRSNPATYVELFDPLRHLFAGLPEARVRGYGAGRFSYNIKGGRCEPCAGEGKVRIEMHYLPDVYVTCEACEGQRYNPETLEIRYKGMSMADVLDLTVHQASELFAPIPAVRRRLETLRDVGLGYIRLGQSATTLSGGEAQRVKLSRELGRNIHDRTLYILDEPTTGLHFDEIARLLDILSHLTELGNTVIVIEHNLDLIRTADLVIDLGPEGGSNGGEVIAATSPQELPRVPGSHTGQYLRRLHPNTPFP